MGLARRAAPNTGLHLTDRIAAAAAVGSVRLFDMRHEFPAAWAAYTASAAHELKITFDDRHYPYWSAAPAGKTRTIARATVVVRAKNATLKLKGGVDGSEDLLGAPLGKLKMGELSVANRPPFTGDWDIVLDGDTIEDAWLLVQWAMG